MHLPHALPLLVLLLPATARAQDAEAGARVFAVCKACHQVGEGARNQTGPVLNGLFGRKAGMVEGYGYSAANQGSGIVWDEPTFRTYIKDPKARVPGTKMMFAGIPSEKRVDDLVAYLHTFDKVPVALKP
jgi:cytochrome c